MSVLLIAMLLMDTTGTFPIDLYQVDTLIIGDELENTGETILHFEAVTGDSSWHGEQWESAPCPDNIPGCLVNHLRRKGATFTPKPTTPLTLELAEEYIEWCKTDTVVQGIMGGKIHRPRSSPSFEGFIEYLKGKH